MLFQPGCSFSPTAGIQMGLIFQVQRKSPERNVSSSVNITHARNSSAKSVLARVKSFHASQRVLSAIKHSFKSEMILHFDSILESLGNKIKQNKKTVSGLFLKRE